MAYRYTDTVKWNDPWFAALDPRAKLLFFYLCDNCDTAGFYEINRPRLAFELAAAPQDVDGLLEKLERSVVIRKGWAFVKNFLYHQKNLPLNAANNGHVAAIKSLHEHQFEFSNLYQESLGVLPGLEDLKEGAGQGLGRGYGNGNGNGKTKGGSGGKKAGGDGFMPPTAQEANEYAKTIAYDLDGDRFVAYYAAKGWKVGGQPMKSWQAAVRTWKQRDSEKTGVKAKLKDVTSQFGKGGS